MIITILGCGTSTGVPLINCNCSVCRSRNPKNKRLRASIWIHTSHSNLLIDTSTDLRQQCLNERIKNIDAVLYTHPHADHIAGIDELRSFNFIQKKTIPLYAGEWAYTELTKRFPYIFNPSPVEGGGIPELELKRIDHEKPFFDATGEKIAPLLVKHGSKDCLGFRIGAFAYVTDCSFIPPTTLDRMRGLSILILDCLRLKPHNTHFNLEQALETVAVLKPKRTYLTHLGHDVDFKKWTAKLPKGVALAYDGLRLKLT